MPNIRGRRRQKDPNARRCRMCSAVVEIGPDGRCALGHQVESPEAAVNRAAAQPHEPARELALVGAGASGESVGSAQSGESAAEAWTSEPAGPDRSRGPSPDEGDEGDPFAHPYDEVLAWEPEASPQASVSPSGTLAPGSPATARTAPAAAPTATREEPDELRSAIDELLTWDDPMDAAPTPPTATPPAAPPPAAAPLPAAPPTAAAPPQAAAAPAATPLQAAAPPAAAPLPAPPLPAPPAPAPAGQLRLPPPPPLQPAPPAHPIGAVTDAHLGSVLDIDLDQLPPPPTRPRQAPGREEFVDEDAEVAVESSRRRLVALLGSGLIAVATGFVAAVYAFPA